MFLCKVFKSYWKIYVYEKLKMYNDNNDTRNGDSNMFFVCAVKPSKYIFYVSDLYINIYYISFRKSHFKLFSYNMPIFQDIQVISLLPCKICHFYLLSLNNISFHRNIVTFQMQKGLCRKLQAVKKNFFFPF
jgi:hypothetical protein